MQCTVDEEHRTAAHGEACHRACGRMPSESDDGIAPNYPERRAEHHHDPSHTVRRRDREDDEEGCYAVRVPRRERQATGLGIDEWLQHELGEQPSEERTCETGNRATPISPHDEQSSGQADDSDDDRVADVCNGDEWRRVIAHRHERVCPPIEAVGFPMHGKIETGKPGKSKQEHSRRECAPAGAGRPI